MDWATDIWPYAQNAWTQAINLWALCQPTIDVVGDFLSNAWIRAIGLIVLVAATIFVIANVYSGDLQNAEIGPVSIRPHTTTRANLSGVILPKSLNIPFSMDGAAADVTVLYVYHDARNRRRSIPLVTRNKLRLVVQPNNLTPVQDIQFGYEVPDVPQESVCYPAFSISSAPEEISATAERASDYITQNKILDDWKEDDIAKLISVPKTVHDDVKNARKEFILDHVQAWERARNGGFFTQRKARRLARNRPNVIGSYYVKFQFKSDPWFVLFKHPDRDLKMTAWLTVLTSFFALLMDAWPKTPTSHVEVLGGHNAPIERVTTPPRPRIPQ